jgi:hypothetical protein
MGHAHVVDLGAGPDVSRERHLASRTANGRCRRCERAGHDRQPTAQPPLGDGGPSERRLRCAGEPLARPGHVGPGAKVGDVRGGGIGEGH